MKQVHYSTFLIIGVVIIIIAGCREGIINNLPGENNQNNPPQILLINDEYETADTIEGPLPYLWVVATDKDGSDDIAAVVLEISSVKLIDIIVRPTDPSEECMRPYYADMDTINIIPYMEKSKFRITKQLLQPYSDGVYSTSISYLLLTEGGVEKHSSFFGEHIKSCRWGQDYLYMFESFGFYPPAPAPAQDVYVTYIKLLISGMKITVYDQSGETATKTIADFICYFTNSLEEQTLP